MTILSWITLLAFVLSVTFCIGFRGLAREWHLIDIPDDRKRHEGGVPLCGGIAIFLSFAIAASIAHGVSGSADALNLLPGLALVLVTGVLDDRFNLPVIPRLAIQLFAAALIIGMTGVQRLHLGLGLGFLEAGSGNMLAVPLFLLLALAFVVGLINAVNMSDGVDGLTGSASVASFFWLAVIGFDTGQHQLGLQTLALAAACLGFLVFNMRHRWRSKASLFLGDGGSTLLGAALAGTTLILATGGTAVAFPILLWIVAVPVIDTLSLIVRRLMARRSPFFADRQHLHHLLMDAGLSCGQTAMAVMALNLTAGALAYAAIRFGLPAWTMLLALLLPATLHTVFVLRITRGPRSLPRPPRKRPGRETQSHLSGDHFMTVSVLIMTLNEEVNLPACMASLEWCDDIVVLDSFSTDRTAKIAEAAGARVYQRAYDTEDRQRMYGLTEIPFKHHWVYTPDADEITPPDLRDEMLAIAADPDRPEVFFKARYKNMFMGRWIRHASLYPTWITRLVRPDRVRFERSVHSRASGGPGGELQAHFIHYSFNKGLAAWYDKHNRYSTAEADLSASRRLERRVDWGGLVSSEPERRRRALKSLSYNLPFRPSLRFLYMYVLRRGFLDGKPGYLYCRLLAAYEFMIVVKTEEHRRRQAASLPQALESRALDAQDAERRIT